jgi:hypothetical protein
VKNAYQCIAGMQGNAYLLKPFSSADDIFMSDKAVDPVEEEGHFDLVGEDLFLGQMRDE